MEALDKMMVRRFRRYNPSNHHSTWDEDNFMDEFPDDDMMIENMIETTREIMLVMLQVL